MINYRIIINSENYSDKWMYDYSSNKGIIILLGLNSAQIIFCMKTKRTIEEIVSFKSPLVRDAYRKVYQLHAVVFNRGLNVNKLKIYSGDEVSCFDCSNENFPFLFSMINNSDLGLNKTWRNLDNAIISSTKSKKDSDLRFASMFSYFASKSREYEIDRFSNLWTSMNSYYSYENKCYEHYLKTEYKISDNSHLKKMQIKQEADMIGAALWQIDNRYTKFSKDEANKIWSDDDYAIEKALTGCTEEEIEELYNTLYYNLSSNELPTKYRVFQDRAEKFGLSAFTFMLFEYSYHWRCKIFHGSRCTLVFSAYNDYEICVMRAINYFLDRFLNENIPQMFSDKFWDEEKQEKMEKYIFHIKTEKESQKYRDLLMKYKQAV